MNKNIIIGVVLLLLLTVTGFFVYRTINKPKAPIAQEIQEENSSLFEEDVPKNEEVDVQVDKSSTDDNTMVVSLSGLNNNYSTLEYEITYESEGIMKGVGSQPVDISGKTEFSRDIYLGTCSRNVCKPDTGVSKISVVLQFTDNDGQKSQFTGDFEI